MVITSAEELPIAERDVEGRYQSAQLLRSSWLCTRGIEEWERPSMLAKVFSSAVLGIDAYIVEVEVDLASGLPYFAVVGLPDASVKESRERVKSAVQNSGLDFPIRRITVNLAPADVRKEGSAFDLPIAIGLLCATGVIPTVHAAKLHPPG